MDVIRQNKLIEETNELHLDFNKIDNIGDVVPVAVQNVKTGEVILLAYANQEAIHESIKTRYATFWSTSRNELWVKGKTSGQLFILHEIRVNCEQNSLVYKVEQQNEGICHTKNRFGTHRNCFYRKLNLESFKLDNFNK